MNVTIVTDASYCPQTGAAGYGCWIVSARGKLSHHGEFRRRVEGSLAAEMMAVVNGLHKAMIEGLALPGDRILIQTDCLGAIDGFKGNRRTSLGRAEREAVRIYGELVRGRQVRVGFRHVKGHTAKRDARSASNRHCDRLAGIHMRAMRSRLKSTCVASA